MCDFPVARQLLPSNVMRAANDVKISYVRIHYIYVYFPYWFKLCDGRGHGAGCHWRMDRYDRGLDRTYYFFAARFSAVSGKRFIMGNKERSYEF